MTTVVFLAIAFLAQIVGTIAGFGSATVLTPAASYLMDIKAAIVMVAFFHLFGNFSKAVIFRRKINWYLFWRFGLASILFTILGAFLSNILASVVVKIVFGTFLICFVSISFYHPTLGLKASLKTSILGGIFSGFVAGLIGTGGAIRAAFLTAFNLDKEDYVATTGIIAVMIDFTRIPVYIMGGALRGIQHWSWIPLMVLVAWVATQFGKKIVHRIPQHVFRNVVLTILLLFGIHLLIGGLLSYG